MSALVVGIDAVSEAEDSPEATLTIDELAALSKVPSRTIRFYQSKALVQAPVMKGRVAFYAKKHLDRLSLIAQLQDRGLRIEAIRDLVKRLDAGELDVSEWLGLDAQLKAPWADDRPRTMGERELLELFGRERVGLLADLVRHAEVERHGDTFLVKSPALIALAGKLEAAGVDVEVSTKAAKILSKHLQRSAQELVELFVRDASSEGKDLSQALGALRPLGLDAVRTLFAREMERALAELVRSGRATKLPAKKRKK